MTTIPERFATAFAARDLDAMVDCFTDDAVYHDIFFGKHHGHNGIRALFTRMFAEGEDMEWQMTLVLTGPDVVVAEWDFAFTVTDAAPSGAGRRLRFPGVSIYETRDGRCHRYREHFDRGAALHAQGIASEKVAAIVARRSTVQATDGSVMLRP